MIRKVLILLAAMCVLSPMGLFVEAKPLIDSTLLAKLNQRFTFHGYAQAGWEYHDLQSPTNDFVLNKLILMGNMHVYDSINAFAMVDFKGFTLHELWVSYGPRPWLNIKFGQFKTPFTIENPISPSTLELITQLSLATTYMIAGGSLYMMPSGAGRDLGLTLYGSLFKGRLTYDVALMNGAGRNKRDNNSQKDVALRLGVTPLKGLMIGASAIWGTGKIDPTTALPGIKQSGNFRRHRYAVGAQWHAPQLHLHLRGEYLWGLDGKVHSNGGYITACASDIGVQHLDAVAGFDHLKGIEITANRWQVGLQYWFYKRCRVQAAYCNTHICGAGRSENAVLTQVQVAF